MLVSIITPCLNSQKTIHDTIESVLRQSYNTIEYIVIDGGSTDGTLEIIKQYVPLFCGRMRYVSEPDKGIYNAMNKGIRMSHGQLIGILNSDDFYEYNAVEMIAEQYKKEEYQVIYGHMRVLSRNRECYVCKDNHRLLLQAMIPHPTCFVTRNVYRDFGLYLEYLKIVADYELMLRLNKTGKVIFQCIPQVITNFRRGGASSGRRTSYEVNLVRFLYGGLSGVEFLKKIIKDSSI
mgnify:CR=1 FL=1